MSALTLIAIECLSLVAVLLALSFIVGRLGIWSVGHLAFFAFGQIVVATAIADYRLGIATALVIVVCAASTLAAAVGLITLRLERDYFVVLSLALAWSIDAASLTIFGARGVSLQGTVTSLSEGMRTALFLCLPVIVIGVAHVALGRSSWAAMLAATRQDPSIAATLGIPTFSLRVGLFTSASAFAAFVGAAHAIVVGRTDPALGDIMRGVLLFCLVVLGGVNSTEGVTFAALLYVTLPRVIEYIATTTSASFYAANINQIVFAVATYTALLMRLRSTSTRGDIAPKAAD